MNLYPDKYVNSVKEITIELLRANNIKGLILDVDNTLIDYEKRMLDGAQDWCNNLKKQGIKMCILSNTNKLKKVKYTAEVLGLEYLYFARKPNRRGFTKARELLNLEPQNIAVVGDQIFTDVLGGNRCKMYTILTKPVDTRDFWYTRVKRPLERIILKKYMNEVKGK